MKTTQLIPLLLVAMLISASTANAGEILGHSVQASQHGSKALAHSAAGAAKLTIGVVAVPLIAVGEVGKAFGDSGDAMWDYANTPLPISNETVTAGPAPSVPSEKETTLKSSTLERGE